MSNRARAVYLILMLALWLYAATRWANAPTPNLPPAHFVSLRGCLHKWGCGAYKVNVVTTNRVGAFEWNVLTVEPCSKCGLLRLHGSVKVQ